MSEDLRISVVVPTHNRARLLSRLVSALEAQDLHSFELVVIDDGSTDDTWQELERLRRESPLDLVALRPSPNGGPAQARNLGWRAARAPLVAFTDDDCVPQPGWLTSLVQRLEVADLVQGRTMPNPAQAALRGPFSHTVETTRESGYYETCNMGYRKEALDAVGGFDEEFRHPFGEDADLAWRAKEIGARSAFEPEALVFHEVSSSRWLDHVRSLPRRDGIVRALKRHPALRDCFQRRWFWHSSHPPALMAAAGLALVASGRISPGRLVLGGALMTPYGRFRTRVEPLGARRRRWPVVIPQALVADLAEVGVLAVSSVRYRTLLL